MVHLIIETVETLDIQKFWVNEGGSGCAQYPPSMMLSLLIYCYATGRFSSRMIEEASWYDVAVRYICGGDKHPDHDTICAFRTRNRDAFKEAFVKVLLIDRARFGRQHRGRLFHPRGHPPRDPLPHDHRLHHRIGALASALHPASPRALRNHSRLGGLAGPSIARSDRSKDSLSSKPIFSNTEL